MTADGGAGVGRGIHGASENRSGVEGGGGLLPIVRIPGGALNEVNRAAAGRSGGRRRRQTGDLGVGLGVHCGQFPMENLQKDLIWGNTLQLQ